MGGEEITQLQHSHKFMEEVDTADMRQTLMIQATFIFLGE